MPLRTFVLVNWREQTISVWSDTGDEPHWGPAFSRVYSKRLAVDPDACTPETIAISVLSGDKRTSQVTEEDFQLFILEIQDIIVDGNRVRIKGTELDVTSSLEGILPRNSDLGHTIH